MAESVKLIVTVDRTQLTKLEGDVKKLGGQTISFNVDSSGLKAANSEMIKTSQTFDAATGKMEKSVDTVNLGIGKTATVITKVGKSSTTVTKTLTEDFAKQQAAVKKQEMELYKATIAYENYAKAQEAARAKIVTPMQAQIEAATGVSRSFKSAAASAAVFQMQGLTPLEKELRNAEKAMSDVSGTSESLISNIAKFTRWYVIGNVISGITRSLREALQTMKSVDDQLVTVRKVTGFTGDQLKEIERQAYRTASAYGVAADAYLESVAAFARAGYKGQSAALAELSTKTQIVGDTTAETANQFLLSVDAAYKYKGSVEALSAVLDGANEIDNKYATSIERIAEGLGTVAPVAAQMHVSVGELTAAIGTITAVTQRSGSEAARALRALFLNIVGDTKTEIDEGVTWTTGEIAGLRDVIKAYAPEAYKAAEATGSIINPMEAIGGLAKSMKDGLLTEQELMSMVSDIGGKLRTSQLLALIQNWDMYQNMLTDFGDAIGSADKEVANALDSWTKKTEQLKNAWTELVSYIVDSEEIKSVLSVLTEFVEILNFFADKGNGFANAADFPKEAFRQINPLFQQLDAVGNTIKLLHDILYGGESEDSIGGMRERLAMIEAAIQSTTDEKYLEGYIRVAAELRVKIAELEAEKASLAETTSEATDATEDNTEAISENVAASNKLATAFEEIESKSNLTYGTLESLEKLYPRLSQKIVDASGNLTEQGESALSTKAAFVDLIAQEYIFNNSSLDVSGKIAALQELATQAGVTGLLVSSAMNSGMQSWIQSIVDEGYTYEEASQSVISRYYGQIQSKLKSPEYLGKGAKTGGSSSSGSTKDAKLERLKDVVSLRQSELSLLEASGASEDKRIEKIREIQSALHDEAEYMRSIGADQAEINALSTQWWKLENDILKVQQEYAKNIADFVDQQEEAAKKPLQEQLDLLKAQKDVAEDRRKEEELLLDVEKARIALENAERERTIRQYNSETGQWEWVANAKTVEAARADLANAEQALAKYREDQRIAALEAQLDKIDVAYDSLRNSINEVTDALANGAITMEQAFAAIAAIIGGFNGANGGGGSGGSQASVLAKMMQNSAAWHNATTQAEKDALAAANLTLGTSEGWTRGADGIWRDKNGNIIYQLGGGSAQSVLNASQSAVLGGASGIDGAINGIVAKSAAASQVVGPVSSSRIGSQHNGDNLNVYLGGIQMQGVTGSTTISQLVSGAKNLALHTMRT